MVPDFKKIEGCIYVSDISSCDTNVLDTGHGLVMHLDTHTAHTITTMIIILTTKQGLAFG